MATRLIPKTELRERIRDHLADLGGDTLVITERGSPLAVTVSVDRWNELQQRLEDLEDALVVEQERAGDEPTRSAAGLFEELDGDVRRPANTQG